MASGDVVLQAHVSSAGNPQSLGYPLSDTDQTHDNGSFDVLLSGTTSSTEGDHVLNSPNTYGMGFTIHAAASYGYNGGWLPLASLGQAPFDTTKTYKVTITEV